VITCVTCDRPSPDGAYLCQADCWPALDSDLHLLGWLDHQLTVTRTRQSRLAGGGRRPAGDQPLGYGAGAATAQDALRNTVTTWARDLWLGRVWPVGTTITTLVTAMRNDPAPIRLHPAADQIVRDVERHRDWALSVINPLDDEATYGVCDAELADGGTCGAYLYGEADAAWVRCRTCHTQHETRERRDWMRRRMEVHYFRAATLARLLPRMIDRPVSASGIRNWTARGKLIRTSTDADGWITYCCGDVITVALTTTTREREGACVA
jgi:hypothetical protein